MFRLSNISALLLVSVLSLLCAGSLAQDQATPSTTIQPALCNETNQMTFDATQIAGTWWEVARNPGTPTPFSCARVNFTMEDDGNVMQINTTYSNTPSYPWVNQTMTASVTLDATNIAGYNISYVNGLTNTTPTVFKLIDTDYQNYAFICGYTNETDAATSFGIVLTRLRTPNTTILNSYEGLASVKYANFLNGTMQLLSQSDTCWLNAAPSFAPINYALWFLIFAVLQLLN